NAVDAGQQPGGARAARPAQQRDAVGAGGDGAHRGAGEQDVTVVVEAHHEHVAHGCASRCGASCCVAGGGPGAGAAEAGAPPRSRSTADSRSGATTGAASISSRRVLAVGTSTALAPTAWAASTSAPMSPTTAQWAGSTPRVRAAAITSP